MYEVSDAYRAAMAKPVQQGRIRGTIASQKGTWSKSFTEANIDKGSLTLTNQCSGNDNVEIGTVYTAQFDCKFIGLDVERYNWLNAVITPFSFTDATSGFELSQNTFVFNAVDGFTV